jgi:hypothetical protein
MSLFFKKIDWNKNLFLLLFFLDIPLFLEAQQETAFEKLVFEALQTPSERLDFMNFKHFNAMDSAAIYNSLQNTYPVLIEKKDEQGLLYWHFLRAYFYEKMRLNTKDAQQEMLEMSQNAAQNAYKEEYLVGDLFYKIRGNTTNTITTEETYTSVLRDYDQMEQLGFERFQRFDLPTLLFFMAKFMNSIDDEDKAFQYLSVAEQYVKPTAENIRLFTLIANHTEDYHSKKGDYAKAMAYNQKIYDFHNSMPVSRYSNTWKGLSLLNIASLYTKMGKPEEGEKYCTQAYEFCKSDAEDLKSPNNIMVWAEFEGLQTLINTKLKLNKTNEAAALLQRTELLRKHITFEEWRYFKAIKWYQNYIAFYEQKNDVPKAYTYMKLLKTLEDSLNRRNDIHKMEGIKLHLNAEKLNAKIHQVEIENQYQKLLRNGMFLMTLLLGGIVYFRYRTIIQKRQFEQEKLQQAEADLANYREKFYEKARLADKLNLEIEQLAQKDEQDFYLNQLYQSTILTDDDWRQFRTTFEKVHPNFINEQKHDFPDITPAELRFLVLEKLGLDVKDMANMMGVARNTIIQTRLRLKKKIN